MISNTTYLQRIDLGEENQNPHTPTTQGSQGCHGSNQTISKSIYFRSLDELRTLIVYRTEW